HEHRMPVPPVDQNSAERCENQCGTLTAEADDTEQERGAGKSIYQPAGRDSCDPRADERYALSAEEQAVVPAAECAPDAGSAGRRCWRGGRWCGDGCGHLVMPQFGCSRSTPRRLSAALAGRDPNQRPSAPAGTAASRSAGWIHSLAQLPIATIAVSSARPLSVSSYSMRTGVVGNTFRLATPSISSSRSRSASMRSLISGTFSLISWYLDLPPSIALMIAPVQRRPISSTAL